MRNLYFAEFTMNGEYILFKIKGNAFLQNMIRIMVGTLIEVGKNNLSLTEFKNIINAKNRKRLVKLSLQMDYILSVQSIMSSLIQKIRFF